MSAGAPWSVKGIDPKAREIAKDLARRSGMTLGEWLNQMILEDPEEDAPQTPVARRSPADITVERRLRLRRVDDAAAEAGMDRVSRALEALTDRIEVAERRSTQAIGGVDQAVAGFIHRLETAEIGHKSAAHKIDHLAADLRAEQGRMIDRLRRVEEEAAGPRSVEALRALEGAMGKLAGQFYESDARTRETALAAREDVATIARRVEALEAQPGAAAVVDDLVARIADRLEDAEARTSDAIRALEGSFSHLDERLGTAEARLGAERDQRFETLASELSKRVESARGELLRHFDEAADGRFDRIERAIGDLTGHVEVAEKRSAEAIEHMGREVVRIARNLDTRMTGVEHASARGVAETRGELGRIAEVVEHRFRRNEDGHAQALERLGQEIGKISEKMSERIASAERRAAMVADEVGDRLAQTADRLETRWGEASAELSDRIRASEERTAKLLDEAREKIDRTLARAERPEPVAEVAEAPVAPAFAPLPEPAFAPPPAPAPALVPAQAAAAAPAPIADWLADETYAEETSAVLESLFDQPAPVFGHRHAESTSGAPAQARDADPYDADHGLDTDSRDAAFEDAFSGDTEFLSEAEFAAREPLSTREAIEAARAAARQSARPRDEERGGFGFSIGGLKLGSKTRLNERIARESKRESSMVKTAALSSAFAVTLTSAVVGYKLILAEPTRGPTPTKKPSTGPLKIVEPDTTPIAAAALTTQSAPTGQIANPTAPADADDADAEMADVAAPPPHRTAPAPKPAPTRTPPTPTLADTAMAASTTRPAPAAPTAVKARDDTRLGDIYQEAVRKLASGETGGVTLLTKAAALGYAPAEFHLGKLYESGDSGVAKDPALARQWTERAAAGGERRAMHNLALFYFDGVGGPKDLIQAAAWFHKAADLGLVDSQYNLGRLYEQGFGVQRDPIQAYRWYLIAAKAGDQESRAAAEQLKSSLPLQDLKEAERSAADFHPGRDDATRLAGR
jgi:localization factor PodJL